MQLKRSILKDLKSCWKRSILKKKDKKANIPMKEKLAFFFLNYWVWQTAKSFHTGPRGLLTFFVQLIRYKIVFVRVRYSSEDFSKKGYFFVGRKNFGQFFHCSFHQFCLHLVTFSKFCQASTQICARFKIFSVSRKSLLKIKTLENGQKFREKKPFGLLLLLSSSLADFREHASKLHKVFRWKMCNFYHHFCYG